MQTLTWFPESLNVNVKKSLSFILRWENIHIYRFFNYNEKNTHTHISFSLILADILRAGKKRFLGDLAVWFVCRMHYTHADRHIGHAHSKSL